MNIWLINHYSVPTKYYPLSRTSTFAKYFQLSGHKVTIFAASTVHNSNLNLVSTNSLFEIIEDNNIRYVLIKCSNYQGNGIKRIKNMLEFSSKLKKVVKHFDKPDAIIASSMTLHACKNSIKIGKKIGCKVVADITDLWPESLVAYGFLGKRNPIISHLRKIEKWIYRKADRVNFTMEGAYDYIIERKWQKDVPFEKCSFINNGVDLDLFNKNVLENQIDDDDLKNNLFFKAVYVGAIRKANDVGQLLKIASETKHKNIKYLVYGGGDDLKRLKNEASKNNLNNIIFKGPIEKKYIPFILSKADLSLFIVRDTKIMRFGISPNKLFDYFAAGKPILISNCAQYNPAITFGAGIMPKKGQRFSDAILTVYNLKNDDYEKICKNALDAARHYDFKLLSERMLKLISGIE